MQKLLNLKQNRGIGGLVGSVIGIMILAIIVIAVTIPVINQVLDTTTSINGTTRTLLTYTPLLTAVLLIVSVVGVMGFAGGGNQ